MSIKNPKLFCLIFWLTNYKSLLPWVWLICLSGIQDSEKHTCQFIIKWFDIWRDLESGRQGFHVSSFWNILWAYPQGFYGDFTTVTLLKNGQPCQNVTREKWYAQMLTARPVCLSRSFFCLAVQHSISRGWDRTLQEWSYDLPQDKVCQRISLWPASRQEEE